MQEVGKKHRVLSGEMWDVAMPAGDAGRTCGFFFGDVDVAPTIVSWSWVFVLVLRPSCRGDAGQRCRPLFVKCLCRYPVRPLRLPERRLTSVPANSGTPYVLFLAKVMPNFFVKFSMTLLKIGHMGYCG